MSRKEQEAENRQNRALMSEVVTSISNFDFAREDRKPESRKRLIAALAVLNQALMWQAARESV